MTYITQTITLERGDQTYYGSVGEIRNPRFGFMENSTSYPYASLSFGVEGEGWGIGDACGRILWKSEDTESDSRVFDNSKGFDFIVRVLKILRAPSIDKLNGKVVMTLWDNENSLVSRCVGIANPYANGILSDDQILIYSEYFQK